MNLDQARQQLQQQEILFDQQSLDPQGLIDFGQTLLLYLDYLTLMGTNGSHKQIMVDSSQKLLEVVAQLEQQQCASQKRFEIHGTFLKLRAIGYQGEAKRQGLRALKALLKERIPARFLECAEQLQHLDHMSFENVPEAHGIKVQTLVALGRFYQRLPWPKQDLDLSEKYLRASISESLTNPGGLAQAVDPVLPRIYLIEVLRQRGNTQDQEEIVKLSEELDILLKRGLSPWEEPLAGVIENWI